jgi:hypothetical protein
MIALRFHCSLKALDVSALFECFFFLMWVQNEGIFEVVSKLNKASLLLTAKFVLYFSRIIIGEVVLEILHAVKRECPYLVLLILPPEELRQLLLDALGCVVEEDHRIVVDGALVAHLSVDSLDVAQFSHEKYLVSAKGGAGHVLANGDFVDGLEVSQRIITSELSSIHWEAAAFVDFLVVEGAIDDLLLDGDEVQFGAEEASVLGLAVLALVDLELIDQVLGLVPQEAEVLVVSPALPHALD